MGTKPTGSFAYYSQLFCRDVALPAVRGKGTIVNVGIFEGDIKINPNIINRRSLRYLGSNIYTREEFQEVIDAIADGRLRRYVVQYSK